MSPIKLPLLFLLLAPFPPGAGNASAEDAPEPAKKLQWELSGELRLRGEYRDNLDLDDQVDDDLRFWLSRIRLGFAMTIQEDYGIFVQAQDARTFGEEASPSSNEKNLDLHQGYADLWRSRPWSLRVGRQEWAYGDERLIGALNWSNTGRSFDGARLRYQHGSVTADALLAAISNEPNGSGGSTGSELYGIYVQNETDRDVHWEAYWVELRDGVAMPGELGLPGTTRVDAVGGRGTVRQGPFDGALELVHESGEIDGDDLQAWAAYAVVGFTFGGRWRTRVFGGYDYATGDEDPADGETEQFFNFFPTNHKSYGHMDLFGWRNIRSYYGGGRFSWKRQWVQAKFHRLSLEDASGPWQDAGGAILGSDPTGQSGRSIGHEVDLNYHWAFAKVARLEGGYSYFEPGRFATASRGPDPQHWAYVMFVIGF